MICGNYAKPTKTEERHTINVTSMNILFNINLGGGEIIESTHIKYRL